MNVKKISEYGMEESALGFSLSYNSNPERAKEIFPKYAHGIPGEGKFLESIVTYWDIDAPRFFWSEFDTYRVGTTKQSESTIHTITKKFLSQEDFEYPIMEEVLSRLNFWILEFKNNSDKDARNLIFLNIKNLLPEGFLQRRIVMTSYKTLQNIYHQRDGHRLPQWRFFIDSFITQINHPEYIRKEDVVK